MDWGGGEDRRELVSEQAWLDGAYRFLAAMVDRTDRARAVADRSVAEEKTADARVAQAILAKRQAALAAGSGPLCFGRIDTDDAERYYVGRRHVEDSEGNEVVVDWRAPVSAPFYRATSIDPCGLDLRRRFICAGPTITAILDEDLSDPDGDVHGGLPDPLLAELGRSRGSAMSDIVSTIAAEQDEIIRSGLDEMLMVQGGPGTGKTAVGLHRAAYLLFNHREYLQDRRVLVVGPNPVFLRYISEVLPSLGETSVSQATLVGLQAARFPVGIVESDDVARLKGDPRMAQVIERLVSAKRRVPDEGLEVASGVAIVRFTREDLAEMMETAAGRSLPANRARDSFRTLIVAEAWRRYSARVGVDPSGQAHFTRGVRTDKAFDRAIASMWPNLSGPVLVRELLGSKAVLKRAAGGILTTDEMGLLWRKRTKKLADQVWSAADIPLLDEASTLVTGVPATYGHVVVDEVQDVSPMGLRMLARRAQRGSMTLLGDLAQATAPASASSWDEVGTHLMAVAPGSAEARLTELTVGYRVPGPVLDLANRLLPEAAPGVTPARSIRTDGAEPRVVEVDPGQLGEAVISEIERLDPESSRAVIAVGEILDRLEVELTDAAVEYERIGRKGAAVLPGRGTTALLDPDQAKGLEFDSVVVVEPELIAETDHGLRRLYVSLTRCVASLSIVGGHWLVEPGLGKGEAGVDNVA